MNGATEMGVSEVPANGDRADWYLFSPPIVFGEFVFETPVPHKINDIFAIFRPMDRLTWLATGQC